MPVQVIIPLLLREYTNNLEKVELTGNTVGECLADLANKYPDIKNAIFNSDGALAGLCPVCNVKDFHHHLEAAEKVSDGDILTILPPGG